MPQKTKRSPRKTETDVKSIVPCLRFDDNAEEAARFYVSLFPDSHVDKVVEAPWDFPSGTKGDVLSVDFTLMGRKFSGLNGGPYFKFDEAISLTVPCESQVEVDRYRNALSGSPRSGEPKEKANEVREKILRTASKIANQVDSEI